MMHARQNCKLCEEDLHHVLQQLIYIEMYCCDFAQQLLISASAVNMYPAMHKSDIMVCAVLILARFSNTKAFIYALCKVLHAIFLGCTTTC